jgi:integrase
MSRPSSNCSPTSPITKPAGFRGSTFRSTAPSPAWAVPRNCAAWPAPMSSPGARTARPADCRHPASGASSALSSLFDYLCERNAVSGNPIDGVKRPMANGNEGSTPALGDAQARKLLEAPPADTLKGVRDRAVLATLLYHGMRREELCGLRYGTAKPPRRGAFPGQGQARQDPVRSRARHGATADRGIPGRRRWRRPRVPSGDEQPRLAA